eukprot:3686163-Alexandrium_andersonii.AAC.1
MRLGVMGSRTVVLAKTEELLHHLEDIGLPKPIKPSVIWNFLKSSTREKLEAFVQSASRPEFATATLGPGDCLAIPAGWTVAEQVATQSDYIGASRGSQLQ